MGTELRKVFMAQMSIDQCEKRQLQVPGIVPACPSVILWPLSRAVNTRQAGNINEYQKILIEAADSYDPKLFQDYGFTHFLQVYRWHQICICCDSVMMLMTLRWWMHIIIIYYNIIYIYMNVHHTHACRMDIHTHTRYLLSIYPCITLIYFAHIYIYCIYVLLHTYIHVSSRISIDTYA